METVITDLEVHDISTKKEIDMYKGFLTQIDGYDPFYKYELLNVDIKDNGCLKYFVYLKENVPAVIMPFFLKQIIIGNENTPYFDVSSSLGYVGPLFSENITVNVHHFWEGVDAWYIENKVITEFVRFNFSGNHIFYSGKLQHSLKNVRGRILNEEVLWNNFNRSVRKNHRNALKNDLKYRIYYKSILPNQIEEFYSIYIGTMDRHAAKESFYHTLEYFISFISQNENRCAIATVYKDEKPISTELLLLSDDTMYSFLGGTDAAFFHMRPNDLLKIESLNWAREIGFDYYVLGGGLKDDDGLYLYKKKFFPLDDDLNFYTGRKVLNNKIYENLCKKARSIKENSDETIIINNDFFPKYRS